MTSPIDLPITVVSEIIKNNLEEYFLMVNVVLHQSLSRFLFNAMLCGV